MRNLEDELPPVIDRSEVFDVVMEEPYAEQHPRDGIALRFARDIIGQLEPMEQRVLALTFGLTKDGTQHALSGVAIRLGLTEQRAWMLLRNAILELRAEMNHRDRDAGAMLNAEWASRLFFSLHYEPSECVAESEEPPAQKYPLTGFHEHWPATRIQLANPQNV